MSLHLNDFLGEEKESFQKFLDFLDIVRNDVYI